VKVYVLTSRVRNPISQEHSGGFFAAQTYQWWMKAHGYT
jgi:hypothetical protein